MPAYIPILTEFMKIKLSLKGKYILNLRFIFSFLYSCLDGPPRGVGGMRDDGCFFMAGCGTRGFSVAGCGMANPRMKPIFGGMHNTLFYRWGVEYTVF